MASILTLYCDNPEQSGSSAGLLTPTQPGASTSTTGWIPGVLSSGYYSRQSFRQERATSTFSTTAEPSGTPLGLAQDCWRLSTATTGDFSAGTWYSSVSVIGVTSGGFQDGRANFRIWRSTDPAAGASSDSIASDDFNRANENPLSGGGNWATITGLAAMQVVGNVATPTDLTTTDNGSRYVGITWPNDQQSKGKLSVVGTGGSNQGVCLYVRVAAGANTLYRLIVDHAATNNVSLQRVVAGAVTTLTGWPVTQAWTDGDLWELHAIGTTLRVFWAGTQVGADTTDATIATGSPGIGLSTTVTSASVEDWEGDSVGPYQITAGRMVGSLVTNLSTTVAQSSSASTQVAAFSLANEYLFLQVGWESTST